MVKRKGISFGTIFFVIVFVSLIVLLLWGAIDETNYQNTCEKETHCYKTECSFWGCSKIRVDNDAPSCELKIEECKDR